MMAAQADPLVEATVLGRYRILRHLARGGMGMIYLARQEGAAGFARPVVIKRVVPDLGQDAEILQMFVREAHILASLHHPHIVDVLDFDQENGAYVMVLEYVQGHDLGQWRRYLRGRGVNVPVDVALHIVIQVLDALQHAHTLRHPDGTPACVVHRDVTPSNILMHVEGYVKLADFGIARMSNLDAHYRTQTPAVKGKLAYLAPELFCGASPSPQSDVYSCAVVLHELLTGVNEFRVGEMHQAVQRILTHVPTAASAVRGDVPRALDAVLARALAKDPKERFVDAASMASALRRLRVRSEAEITAALAARLRDDFKGPLPSALGVTPIEVLDAAWRDPETTGAYRHGARAQGGAPQAGRAGPTVPVRHWGGARPAEPPLTGEATAAERVLRYARRMRASLMHHPLAWFGAATVGTLLGALLVAWAATPGAPEAPAEPQYILYDRAGDPGGAEAYATRTAGAAEDGAEEDAGEAAEEGGADTEPVADTPSPRRTARRSRPARADGSAELGGAFARERARIEACFAAHVAGGEPAPRLSVRFRIEASGAVRSAEVVGADASAPLSRCLLKVAHGTHFPAQPEPLTFRIPISVTSR
jgi:eukaryotic-like serine/threonine-protein kinase